MRVFVCMTNKEKDERKKKHWKPDYLSYSMYIYVIEVQLRLFEHIRNAVLLLGCQNKSLINVN